MAVHSLTLSPILHKSLGIHCHLISHHILLTTTTNLLGGPYSTTAQASIRLSIKSFIHSPHQQPANKNNISYYSTAFTTNSCILKQMHIFQSLSTSSFYILLGLTPGFTDPYFTHSISSFHPTALNFS